VNSIVVTSEGSLTVSLEEAEAFQALATFNGRDNINSVFSESSSSSQNFTTWHLDFLLSAATQPPSSANSQIFFSDASTNAVLGSLNALLGASFLVNAQCAESTSVAFSLPAGWAITDEGAKRVVLDYSGPHAYGYDIALILPGESTSSWTDEDTAALVASLQNFYGDSNLFISVTAIVNSDGGLVLTVNVLGFTTLSGATASSESVSANGIVFTDSTSSRFAGMLASASAPGISCQTGFTTDSVGICVDTNGCIDNTCGDGLCIDAVAPFNGYSCQCDAGYFDSVGTCINIDGCLDNTCGSNGACVDVAPPGTGFTCTCNSGYVSTDLVCVNEPGCANDPVSCSTTDSSGACADVAPPGTGFTCTCSAGFVVDTTTPSSPTCTYRDCGAPSVQTGYTFNSGTTYYTSTRTATCASGYSGTATSITCGANGQWSASAGCTLNCSTSPTQTNYVIATGASNQGATRTVTCGSGYSGTASSITCGTNSAWSTSSGCTLNCSTSPTQTGYTVSAGASNQGATRTTSCASGYSGTGTSITCQSNSAWSSASGCTLNCNAPSQTGYTFASGGLNQGATRTATCASGYTGTASTITCGTNSVWSTSSGCTASGTVVGSFGGWTFYKTMCYSLPLTDDNIRACCAATGRGVPCACGGGGSYDDGYCVRTSETGCGNPMYSLSSNICGTAPPSCGALNNSPGTFTYMGNRWAGGCGTVSGGWCTQGNSHYSAAWVLCV